MRKKIGNLIRTTVVAALLLIGIFAINGVIQPYGQVNPEPQYIIVPSVIIIDLETHGWELYDTIEPVTIPSIEAEIECEDEIVLYM